ncbi:MAG: PAS domain S-box protein [Chitinophagaceae bacterium]|nr:MAG: PAS domain S-box protein [Chitinophagaceae bacterium]
MPYSPPSPETLKALETAPNMYLVLSPGLYILTASDMYLEATNNKRELIVGKHIFEAFPANPDLPDADGVQNINFSLQEVLRTRKPHFMEIQRYDVPDILNPGQFITRFWDPSHSPVFTEDGEIHYIIQMAVNVTDKILAQEALLRQMEDNKRLEISEKHFRNLADIVPAKISNALPDGQLTFLNDKWLDYTGMSFEDMRDFGYHQMMHPEEVPSFQIQLAEAAAKGVALESEMRFRDKYGVYRWHLNVASPVFNDNGELIMWVGSTTDIQRMKEEDRQVQQMINMLPASVVVIRTNDLVVEMINQSNLDYWNKTAEEVIGRRFLDILPDLADQPFAGQLRHVIATGEIIDVKESPVLFENEDGTIRETFVDYTYQPLTDLNGIRNGVLVMSFEITDRVMSRRLLERYAHELQSLNELLVNSNRDLAVSEQRFKYLIHEAPVAIGILTGRDLVITSANGKILEVWGKHDGIIGLSLIEALPELQGQPFLQILDDVYTTGQAFHATEIPAKLEYKDGLKELFFNVVYQPIQPEFGVTTDILVVAVDVTEQVNARRRIEQAESMLRLALEAANVGTWSMDVETRELNVSSRLKELFGFRGDETVTMDACVNQIAPEHRDRVIAANEDVLDNGGLYDISYPVQGFHDKKSRWLRARGNMSHSAQTNRASFTGVIMDISDVKQEETRKNDFFGMVSHELKTPLTSVKALLQLARMKLNNTDDQFLVGAMDKANVQVNRMTAMINGFLDISRFESGKIHIDKQYFDCSALIQEVINEVTFMLGSHVIAFENNGPVIVSADREKIMSVISNLISNARKYSPQGKYITITCTRGHQEIVVSVKDEGMGIKPGDLEKIFDRYYRSESSHTRNIAGFGIGLYLSSEIIHRHEGRIWATSEAGVGSAFYFSLPL